jgi:hypothetical protein
MSADTHPDTGTAGDTADRPPDLAVGICAVDFPCFVGYPTHFCTDRTHYQAAVTHDCTFHCGPGCAYGTGGIM